MGVRDGP
jgi:nucleoside-specific outer membrane channel protein Tsx